MPRKLPIVANVQWQRGEDGLYYDCVACGACCGPEHAQLGWPDITRNDVAKLTAEEFHDCITTEPNFPAFKVVMGSDGYSRCMFLEGKMGTRVACGMYTRRPEACSAFIPGSHGCRGFRKLRRIDSWHKSRGVIGVITLADARKFGIAPPPKPRKKAVSGEVPEPSEKA